MVHSVDSVVSIVVGTTGACTLLKASTSVSIPLDLESEGKLELDSLCPNSVAC